MSEATDPVTEIDRALDALAATIRKGYGLPPLPHELRERMLRVRAEQRALLSDHQDFTINLTMP